MRKPILAANWKLHKTIAESLAFVELSKGLDALADQVEIVICAPFTALSSLSSALRGKRIGLGAQDVYWENEGAFTGEVSAAMLADAGCRYVIIGHSERRQLFGETDAAVRKKLIAAIGAGLTPIVCVGETLTEHEANQTFAVIERQLTGCLADGGWDAAKTIVAYEPVWAIGTGRNATPEQAQEAHAFIRQWVSKRSGSPAGASLRIQYGGSVNAANAASLLQQPDVDGALVGGSSLKAEGFSAIVKAALEAKAVTPPPAGPATGGVAQQRRNH